MMIGPSRRDLLDILWWSLSKQQGVEPKEIARVRGRSGNDVGYLSIAYRIFFDYMGEEEEGEGRRGGVAHDLACHSHEAFDLTSKAGTADVAVCTTLASPVDA